MTISLAALGKRISLKEQVIKEDLELYEVVERRRNALRVGDHLVPLIPLDAEDHLDEEERKIAKSQIILWAENRPDCEGPPRSVDHRGLQTPVKDQLDRGTCVCFASLACLEALIKAGGNGEVLLSEQFANWLFMRFLGKDQCEDRMKTTLAASYLSSRGVCENALSSYENRQVVTTHCHDKPAAEARTGAVYGIGGFSLIDGLGLQGPSIQNTGYLECLLYRGYDIVFGTHVAWGQPDARGVHDVKLDEFGNPASSRGGHAMLIVGYHRSLKGSYFIVKNSMGTGYAHNGYMYLSYDYVRLYAKYGFIVHGVRTDMPVGEE